MIDADEALRLAREFLDEADPDMHSRAARLGEWVDALLDGGPIPNGTGIAVTVEVASPLRVTHGFVILHDVDRGTAQTMSPEYARQVAAALLRACDAVEAK